MLKKASATFNKILLAFPYNLMLIADVKIKERPKTTKKQKAYLKWMGLDEPKQQSRLSQLNKHNRSALHQPSEFILMAKRLEVESPE